MPYAFAVRQAIQYCHDGAPSQHLGVHLYFQQCSYVFDGMGTLHCKQFSIVKQAYGGLGIFEAFLNRILSDSPSP